VPVVLTLETLGNSGAGPFRGAACTGYLVSTAEARILIDCGPGVATALSREPIALDAVFITHLHADHCYDLIALAMSLRVQNGISTGRAFAGGADEAAPVPAIPVHIPPGGRAIVRAIEALFPVGSPAPFDSLTGGVLEFRDWTPGEAVLVGDLRVEPFPGRHTVPAVGLVISDRESRLAFTGDTGLFDGLVEACAGADAVLSEASLIGRPSQRQHMSARDAGELAQRAGVGLLILTHFVEGPADVEARATALAAETFTGRILTTLSSPVITLGKGAP